MHELSSCQNRFSRRSPWGDVASCRPPSAPPTISFIVVYGPRGVIEATTEVIERGEARWLLDGAEWELVSGRELSGALALVLGEA